MLPLLCIGHMIFSLHSVEKIPVSYILLKRTFKNGKTSFIVTLIISMHIPSGLGERFQVDRFSLAIISSLVI